MYREQKDSKIGNMSTFFVRSVCILVIIALACQGVEARCRHKKCTPTTNTAYTSTSVSASLPTGTTAGSTMSATSTSTSAATSSPTGTTAASTTGGKAGGLAVTVPLYIWPSASNWQPYADAAKAHPSVKFNLVINPNNGPDGAVKDEFATGIALLRKYSNIKIIGYVRTTYGDRAPADVNADVTTYANWPAASRPDGIFFDETAPNNVAYMKSITAFAKGTACGSHITFNPGADAISADYFDIADDIMIYEHDYNSFQSSLLTNAKRPAKSTAAMYEFPTDASTLASVVSSFKLAGWYSLFLTTSALNNAYSTTGSNWSAFVTEVAK